jgi:translation initiation factor eIF-2B subunit alpha
MKAEAHQALYNLIRAYMHAVGTSRTTVVALKSYIDAVQRLNCAIADIRPMLEGP